MRIAMIGQKGMPAKFGGVERHVHELSVRLVKVGHKVTVYSRKWYTDSKDKKIDGVEIKHLPSIHTKHLDAITHSLLATLDAIKNKYDIIHYHGVGPSLIAWLPRLLSPKIKIVVTFHSIDRKHEKWNCLARFILRLSEWTACRFAHETIAVSRTIEQYCRDVYDKETVYIPNGVPEYAAIPKTNKSRRWNIKSKKYILMVSRLIPHKGAHYLIEAYQKLNQTKPELIKDIKLVIVGDGHYTDGYVKELKKIAKSNHNIIFTGFQTGETLSQLFAHALIMVHPSDNEGLPINVLEGMSRSLPILLSDITEHRELVSNEDYLFYHSDVESLADKLAKLLNKNAGELRKQGAINREKVKRQYNWEKITKKTDVLYRVLAAKRQVGIQMAVVEAE